jgi:phospholipid/cholesterol/gamma-HCH transport system permease protein
MTSFRQIPEAGTELKAPTAKLEAGTSGSECLVKIGGDWRLNEPVPLWTGVLGERTATSVRAVPEDLGKWDTSLVLFLVHGQAWCVEKKIDFKVEALPANLRTLLRQVAEMGAPKPKAKPAVQSRWALAETLAKQWASDAKEIFSFVGECTLGFVGVMKRPRRFRWLDCLLQMQQCWASSLPIVSLVSFLVGVILAFEAAIQLRAFGAAVYVADLVGLAVVREMGPMMAAVIVAGGTGAGFAAQLGNMKVDEEIDAFETLGISSVDFLALPRLVAVAVMMPILAAYANVLGILGGMFVSGTMLDVSASAYWIETQNRVGMIDVGSGLSKSIVFGLAVGLAGCLRGMKCDRSAAGVGAATSSAVVTGITLIVLADALFAVIFNVLGI